VPSFTIYLPKRLYDRVAALADEENVSVGHMSRMIIEAALDVLPRLGVPLGEKKRRGERGATA